MQDPSVNMCIDPVIDAMSLKDSFSTSAECIDTGTSNSHRGISDCDLTINGFQDMIKQKVVKKKNKTKNKASTAMNQCQVSNSDKIFTES